MEKPCRGLIIPAYNEEKTILEVVNNASIYTDVVIVVDDNSKDQTYFLATVSGAHVVKHPKNKGYDGSLNTGFQEAVSLGCKYVVTFDADGQHDENYLREFYESLERVEADLIIGIRPSKARISERVFGLYFKIRFEVEDILCGMKGYNMKVFQDYGQFDTIGSIGTELSMIALKKGHKLKQLKIPIHQRQFDKPRFGNIIKSNLRIFAALAKIILLDAKTCMKFSK